MALTPEQIAALRDACEELAEPISQWLLQDIAQRIAQAGRMTSTAAYELYRTRALGESKAALRLFLREQLKLTRREVRRLFRQAARFSYDNDHRRLGIARKGYSESFEQTVTAAAKLAGGKLTNLTKTLGMVDRTGKALPLQRAYRSAMDFAFSQVFSGAADTDTAVAMATRKMAAQGVRVIDYESGVHTGLEAAVRRNMLSGLGMLDEQVTQQNHDELGCNGWEISAHANSAPDHEPIQGRQYSDADYTALNNSLARRIGTLNCGHIAMPIMLGLNSPQYTEAELQKFREDNARGITYEGRHYTGYEATQKQRQLERAIRAQKNRILIAEAAGDAERLQTAQIRLRMLERHYREFSRAAGLRTRTQRAQVAGFGPGQAARASAAYQRQESLVGPFKRKMQEAGISVKGFDSYAGDARTLEEMRMAFTKLAEQFPETAKELTVVLSHSTDNSTIGWFDRRTHSIHYNGSLLKNWSKLQEEYGELMESGHFPAGTDARALFYHEYGHAVWATRGMGSLRGPVDRVLRRFGYGYMNVSQRKAALMKELSIYAKESTNPAYQEVIAESFSEWYTSNEPRRFCIEFLKEVGVL